MNRSTRPADGIAPMKIWTVEPLDPAVAKAVDRLARTEDVAQLAVLPDVHLAEEVCVGVAVATGSLLLPAAVGGDIGCGMAALRFNCDSGLLEERYAAAHLLEGLATRIPIMTQPRNNPGLPAGLCERTALLDDGLSLSHETLQKRYFRERRRQLGTLGRGNHFIEFQEDEAGALWLMVHSGSRAMGQAIRAHHLKKAERTSTGLAFLRSESLEGKAYLADMDWALRYAETNRRVMVAAVAEVLQELFGVEADRPSLITCNHNFVLREQIDGQWYWIHRKGVISAASGEAGLVPGSMGAQSFHVEGRGSPESLFSSSHGAGRTMSRSQARQHFSVRMLEHQMGKVWFDHRKARRLVEEAPGAYKDISAVMRAQRGLTKIVRRLRPILSFKGG